jgi:magnesium transporter
MAPIPHRKRRRRRREFHRGSAKPGAPAGAHPGLIEPPQRALPTQISSIVITNDRLDERRSCAPADLPAVDTVVDGLIWVDVAGLADMQVITELAARFQMHPLAVEDVLHVHQRAKVEQFDDQIFIVARMPEWLSDDDGNGTPYIGLTPGSDHAAAGPFHLGSDQLSMFLGKNYVITLQERLGDCFEPIRLRLRQGYPNIRIRSPDRLAHAILDAIIDSYFPIVEQLGERLGQIEDRLSVNYSMDQDLRELHEVRVDLLQLRRMIWPFREAIGQLMRNDNPLIQSDARLYLRDCYDHTVQLIDVIETYREICAELRELHYAHVSQQANETMRVLTIISTLFIPMTFIAGVYGMNFDPDYSPLNMPELRWWWGYPMSLVLMGMVAIGMLTYFYRRKWL